MEFANKKEILMWIFILFFMHEQLTIGRLKYSFHIDPYGLVFIFPKSLSEDYFEVSRSDKVIKIYNLDRYIVSIRDSYGLEGVILSNFFRYLKIGDCDDIRKKMNFLFCSLKKNQFPGTTIKLVRKGIDESCSVQCK